MFVRSLPIPHRSTCQLTTAFFGSFRNMSNINPEVPGANQYYPLNVPAIGTALPKAAYPQNANVPKLFEPITIRGVTFKNRIWVSPMCQYSSDNGHATDWHLVHIGGFASRGVGAICMEATAVVPEGRISPEDAGLWTDSQIAPLKRIVDFAHAQGTLVGVQLAHAGRKASTLSPWMHINAAKTHRATTHVAQADERGWPDGVYSSSDIAFNEDFPTPKAATEKYLDNLDKAFIQAVERCKQIGFDFIEVHGAHGYLIHNFLSPLANDRKDQFGGSLENRMRWPLRAIEHIRKAWDKPLFVRISATDWAQGPEQVNGEWKQWGIEQSKVFVGEMIKLGVDLVDCSSGGGWAQQEIPIGPGYQVPFAHELKKVYPNLPVGSVGMITEPKQAESILKEGKADVVFLARELLRNPHWALVAAQELSYAIKPANQYERSWMKMLTAIDPPEHNC